MKTVLKNLALAKLFMTIFLHNQEKNMKIISRELHTIFNRLTDENYRNKMVKFFWNEYLNQKSVTKISGCRKCKL